VIMNSFFQAKGLSSQGGRAESCRRGEEEEQAREAEVQVIFLSVLRIRICISWPDPDADPKPRLQNWTLINLFIVEKYRYFE
jgi:hypothetical protein